MTDRIVRDAVIAAIDRLAMNGSVAVSVTEGITTLFGHVATAGQRFAAEAAACRSPGVRAVLNRIGIGGVFDPDALVARAAVDALDAIEDLAGNPICVSVVDGVVTLHGEVPEERQRIIPEQELLRLAEVDDVRNLLHVALPSGDARSQLLQLMRRQDLAIKNLAVDIRDGTVLLTGQADGWFDRDVAERLAWTLSGVHAVTNRIVIPAEAVGPEGFDVDLG